MLQTFMGVFFSTNKCVYQSANTEKGIAMHDSRHMIHKHYSRSRFKLAAMPRARFESHDPRSRFDPSPNKYPNKVEDLAGRGFTLETLLTFCEGLGTSEGFIVEANGKRQAARLAASCKQLLMATATYSNK